MHRATVLGRNPSRTTHAAKGPLPSGAAAHFGKPSRPPLARRRHHLKHRGHRRAVFGIPLSRHGLSDDALPCRGSDCCVWADLTVALVVLGLFGAIVYAHTLLPPIHP